MECKRDCFQSLLVPVAFYGLGNSTATANASTSSGFMSLPISEPPMAVQFCAVIAALLFSGFDVFVSI